MQSFLPQAWRRGIRAGLAAQAIAWVAACGGGDYADRVVLSLDFEMAGADTDAMHRFVTLPVEAALAKLPSVELVMSVSRAGNGRSEIMLKAGADSRSALAGIHNAVLRAQRDLPPSLKAPVLHDIDAASRPIGYLALTGEQVPRSELAALAQRLAKGEIWAAIAVAARLDLGAVPRRIIRIRVDPARLAAYGIARTDVETALRGQGYANIGTDGSAIVLDAETTAPTSLDSLPVKAGPSGEPIRLRDVAAIELALEPFLARINGRDAVVVRVLRAPGIDAARASEAVLRAIEIAKPGLPAAITLEAWPPALSVPGRPTDFFVRMSLILQEQPVLRIALSAVLLIAAIGGIQAWRRSRRE